MPSSDLSSSQLRNKINCNFWTTCHRLKCQKAKLVRIKFVIELSNFYLKKSCLRQSESETYKSACPLRSPSLPKADLLKLWLVDFSDSSPAVLIHHSLMLGVWNFDKAFLTIRQLLSCDVTFLFQLLTAVIHFWKFSRDAFWVHKCFCNSKTKWVTNFWMSSAVIHIITIFETRC